MKKALTLSIIIPVYNEEHHLRACLNAIAQQTVMPGEVIVVDNNSTDKSVEIAKQYPFVRVIRESTQGRGAARNAGFDAARTDIVGRIDADSLIAPDWVERVLRDFEQDSAIVGLTGLGITASLPRYRQFHTVLWTWLYFQWSAALFGVTVLWGANMAIRRKAWADVKDKTYLDDTLIHEDHDLSLLLSAKGYKVVRDNLLRIQTNEQSYHYFPKLVRYTWMRTTTKHHHRDIGSFKTIHRQFSLLRRALTYLALTVPAVPFYAISFLLWPLDGLMKIAGRAKAWLS